MLEKTIREMISKTFQIPAEMIAFVEKCEEEVLPLFQKHQKISEANQYKVIEAFKKNDIATRHFIPTTGYGYSDEGRDKLGRVFADTFHAEAAIASPLFMSGTHAITTALFGILRPKDAFLSITGRPYDTFLKAIGSNEGFGSLTEWGISYFEQPLAGNAMNTEHAIKMLAHHPEIRMIYIQRSRGYDIRPSLSVEQIGAAVAKIRASKPDIIVMVDNCYGEFTELMEPTAVGADIIAGSLIKNPGGGLAPTGGYIAGKRELVEKISHRFTAPGIGMEIGSYAGSYLPCFQGFFMAPHVVCQAMMGVILASQVFRKLGYSVNPLPMDERGDITQSIIFENEETLTAFIRGIQKASAVDGNVVPYAWDMPGYEDKVIMAAGTFIQGASIELTADAPIREPYAAYMQGALTYEHAKLGILYALKEMQLKL